MKGRVLNFDEPAHRAAEMLLPWFVNGTLIGEDLLSVERHLKECARCQREADSLREMQAAYAISEAAPDASASFQKLRPRLDEPRGVLGLVARLRGFWRQTQIWARWTVVAELLVIFVLGALLVSGTQPASFYRTLGAVESASHAAGSLVVVFDPRITEAELRRIVRGIGARFVDGPTAANAYVLELPAEQQVAALKTLRAERAVVLAERLGPETAR
ncbi:MAG: S8 family serine peptidase [Sulfuricaulis sp.]